MHFWKTFLLILCVNSLSYAAPIATLVVFGDSLSDTGNSYALSHYRLPSAPYYQGRFSNGPIWIDKLSAVLPSKTSEPLPVLNYAFGGAGVLKMKSASFLLSQEIDSYLLSHADISSDHLLILWIGANDYLMSPEGTTEQVQAVVKKITENVSRLVMHGAKHMMIVSLPNLGATPYARDLEWTTELAHLTQSHNQQLHQMFNQMQIRYPNVDWIYVDTTQLFLTMIRQPKLYGVTNSLNSCVSQAKSGDDLATSCQHYLFFDPIHPTSMVHEVIAEYMAKQILALR